MCIERECKALRTETCKIPLKKRKKKNSSFLKVDKNQSGDGREIIKVNIKETKEDNFKYSWQCQMTQNIETGAWEEIGAFNDYKSLLLREASKVSLL